MDKLTIIKAGGQIVEDPGSLNFLMDQFIKISGQKILIHGGGRTATTLAEKLGIESRLVNGRRVTGKEMLDVVTMVYGGLINKKIVAGLQARDCNALGLTGADLNFISARKRPAQEIDYGYVGDVEAVNTRELKILLNENVVPVVAPLTHDGKGNILNTNADTIACEIAIELAGYFQVFLFYCFEKKGVLTDPDDENSIIREIDKITFQRYVSEEIITTGMIPKLENGFRAKSNGVREVLITNTEEMTNGRGTRLI
jgi:acetylglutamate kinase